jgi:hypothetical protein
MVPEPLCKCKDICAPPTGLIRLAMEQPLLRRNKIITRKLIKGKKYE